MNTAFYDVGKHSTIPSRQQIERERKDELADKVLQHLIANEPIWRAREALTKDRPPATR
jgi:hypothetical protein